MEAIEETISQKELSIFPTYLWIGLSSRMKNKKLFNLPTRFRPSPLNLIFKDLSDQKRVLDKKTVDISVIDFDAY